MEDKVFHTVEPTVDFWNAEMEKCKADTYYYFTNYWLIDGKPPSISRVNFEGYNRLGNPIKSRDGIKMEVYNAKR